MASCAVENLAPFAPLIDQLNQQNSLLWEQERACLLLLLEARVLLHVMTQKEQQDPRGLCGGCRCGRSCVWDTLIEIHDQLKQDPPTDLDCSLQLGALKRQVIQEIKRNNALNANIARLDVKISLLIHNRSTTHELATKRREMWITRWVARKMKENQKLPMV
jgi:hypothetical protein